MRVIVVGVHDVGLVHWLGPPAALIIFDPSMSAFTILRRWFGVHLLGFAAGVEWEVWWVGVGAEVLRMLGVCRV